MICYLFQIGEVKQFTTSDGRKGHRLELKLFDDSVSSFPIVLCVTLIHSVKHSFDFYICCFCGIFHFPGL